MSFEIIILLVIFVLSYFIFFRKNNKKPTYNVSKTNVQPQRSGISTIPTTEALSIENDSNNSTSPRELPDGFLTFKVNMESDLTPEKLLDVTRIAKTFKKPNPVIFNLIKDGFEPKELFNLIKADPKMTAKVLNAVNSPTFALRTPITSIQHAIIFLGVNGVKNVVMQLTMQDAMTFETPQQEKTYQKLSAASYMASAFCFLLAQELGKENTAELSTRCLLCYLGDMAMLSSMPELADDYLLSESLFERIQKSQNTYGMNAAIMGKAMAQAWSLPEPIVHGINNSLSIICNVNTSKNDVSYEVLQDNLLCYLACRFGDFFAFHGMKDITTVNWLGLDHNGPIEFHNVQNHINQSDLHALNKLFTDANFIRKSNKLLKNHN